MVCAGANGDAVEAGGMRSILKTYDVRDITNFILDCVDDRKTEVSNLALQKLLYFVHGWFSSVYDEPLIRSKFESWQLGPVQRVIYDQFKQFGDAPIKNHRARFLDPATGENIYRKPVIDDSHAGLIQVILERYVRFSASQLVNLSHVEDGPWETVWEQSEDYVFPGMRIPDELISRHFRSLKPIWTFH